MAEVTETKESKRNKATPREYVNKAHVELKVIALFEEGWSYTSEHINALADVLGVKIHETGALLPNNHRLKIHSNTMTYEFLLKRMASSDFRNKTDGYNLVKVRYHKKPAVGAIVLMLADHPDNVWERGAMALLTRLDDGVGWVATFEDSVERLLTSYSDRFIVLTSPEELQRT
ncbi:hypothetical protein F7U66_01950 [Vibrio parahaemolyticus]|nr:hypothetical protein [Vibrio parahaemolyticus]